MIKNKCSLLSVYLSFILRLSMLFLVSLLPLNTLLAQELSGITAWAKRVELSTPIAGVIFQVNAVAGEKLKQGEVLLVLDKRNSNYRVRGLQAKLDKLKVVKKEMQAELKRAQELYERTLLSDHELELAKIEAVSAGADYQLAKSELSVAQLEKEYTSLRAPFDSIVLSRKAEKGQIVSPIMMPQILFVVASSKRMRILSELDGNKIKMLKQGQRVKVQIDGRIFSGYIFALGLEPLAQTGKYLLEVEFETLGEIIRAGKKVKLIL